MRYLTPDFLAQLLTRQAYCERAEPARPLPSMPVYQVCARNCRGKTDLYHIGKSAATTPASGGNLPHTAQICKRRRRGPRPAQMCPNIASAV